MKGEELLFISPSSKNKKWYFVLTRKDNSCNSGYISQKFVVKKESDDEIHVTLINKVKGWRIYSMTIEIEFNEDGLDETIESTGSTAYCRYQEKCKFDFYPGIRWGIRKNYKSWWVVKIMGKRI